MDKYSNNATGFTKILDNDGNVIAERMRFPVLIRKILPVETPKRNGAYWDLFLPEDIEVPTGEFFLIPLGIAIKLPKGYHAELVVRSSTPIKWGIISANSIGVIDGTYCGNKDMLKLLALRPFGLVKEYPTVIPAGTRIAQFTIVKDNPVEYDRTIDFEFQEVDNLPDPSRGGFGSTGE